MYENIKMIEKSGNESFFKESDEITTLIASPNQLLDKSSFLINSSNANTSAYSPISKTSSPFKQSVTLFTLSDKKPEIRKSRFSLEENLKKIEEDLNKANSHQTTNEKVSYAYFKPGTDASFEITND